MNGLGGNGITTDEAAELGRQKSLSQKLIRLLPYTTMIFDVAASSHSYVSPNVEKLVGYSAEEILAMGSLFYERLYDPAELAGSLANKKELFELKDGEQDTKFVRLRHKHGGWVHTQRTVVVFERDARGLPISFLGVIENLNEKLRLDQGLRRILDGVPALISHWNRDLTCVAANRAYGDHFSRAPEKMQGGHIRHLLGEEGFAEAAAHIEGVLRGEERTFEREQVMPDGGRKSLVVKFLPETVQEQVVGFHEILLDITELRALESANSRQEKFLQALLDATPSKIFVKDLQGRYLVSNLAHTREHGRGDIIGKTIFELFPRETAEMMRGHIRDVAETGEGKTLELEFPYGNQLRWNLVSLFPLKDEHEKTYALGGIVTDIHDSKLSKARYQSLFDAVDGSASVAMTDRMGRITFVNDRFIEVCGFSRDELIGQDHRLVNSGYHPPSFFKEMWDTISAGRPWNGEIRNRRKDGSHYWVSMTIAPIQSPGHDAVEGYVAIRFDITAVKLAREKLMQSAKMSSLGEMAGGVAHEINNPLAIIQGKAVQLRKKLRSGTIDIEDFERQLIKIETTAERIAKIIKGLQTFSRNAEADPMETVAVTRIIEDTIELCRERFRNHAIELRLSQPDDIFLTCRPSQISQILMNLLGNAHDAVEKLKDRWVSVEVHESDERVRLIVTDSGHGIPPEISEKMMQPFFTTKEIGKGTGLGLSIAKGIAEDHHGQLRYEPGCGHTRFILELPGKRVTGTP